MSEIDAFWPSLFLVLIGVVIGYVRGREDGYDRGRRDERLGVRFEPTPEDPEPSHYMKHVLGLPAKKFGTTSKGDPYHYYTVEELIHGEEP